MIKIFPKFDARLKAELSSQRVSIWKGLVCVALTSLLTALTIPLMREALQSITNAGNIAPQAVLAPDEARTVARELKKTEVEVVKALGEVEKGRGEKLALSTAEKLEVSKRLGVSQGAVDSALKVAAKDPTTVALQPTGEAAIQRLGWACLAIVLIFFAKYFFTRGVTYYLSRAANRLASNLRTRLFDKLQRLPISYFNDKRAGNIQSVLNNDVNMYQTAVTIVRDSIEGPVKAILAFLIILSMQWQLAGIAALLLPFMIIVIQRNGKRMRVAQRDVQDDLASLSGVTQELLQGTRVVRAFGAEDQVLENYRGSVDRSFHSQMEAVKIVARLRPLVELIGALGLALVLYLCGWLAFQGDLQVADIAAIVYALDVINQGLRNIASVNNTYAGVMAASERIYAEVLDVPEEHFENRGTQTLGQLTGNIEFQNVSFHYPDGTAALKDVSFTIPAGSSLALVGPSGAGKSTIADLLLRFYDPTHGRILLDGVDIKDLETGWFRNQIGVVPQHTFLFAGSVEENLLLGAKSASPEALRKALEAAHATEFADELSQRADPNLGERGSKLSGGQMQRIAIARALVRDPKILLLDEATSALDANSEKIVTEALAEVMQTRTTLFIAHRLTTAARADRILLLRRGEVVEVGSHRELMSQNGEYAALFKVFSSGVMDGGLG